MIEWSDVLRIARASDQLRAAMLSREPLMRQRRIVPSHTWYDLRGEIDEIPGLMLVFSTSMGLRPGMNVLEPGGGATHVLRLPQFFFDGLNRMLVGSQSFIHHELAHILLGHAEDPDFADKFDFDMTRDYFNHPYEIEAFTHQAVAGLALRPKLDQRSWTSGPYSAQQMLGGNVEQFVKAVIKEYPVKAYKALSPGNKELVAESIASLHAEATRHLFIENHSTAAPSI